MRNEEPGAASATSVEVSSRRDLLVVLREVRRLAYARGLPETDSTRLLTATSELVNNVLVHAGAPGRVEIEAIGNGSRGGVRVTVSDRGRGIEDLDLALQDGYSTGGGLGVGLPGAKRLVDEFELDTTPGEGTVVRIAKWGRSR